MSNARTGVFVVLRATPTPVKYLLGGMLVNQLGAFVQTFLILYLTVRGISVSVAGICLAAYSVGSIFGAMLGGELAHRFGPRTAIVAAMTCAAPLITLIPPASDVPWMLFTVVALAGLATQAYRPAAAVLLADLMPEQHRVMGFSMMRIALNIGAAVAPLLAALLILVDWDLLFWLDGVTAALWALLAFLLLPKGTTAQPKDDLGDNPVRALSARAVYTTMIQDYRFLCFLVAGMLGMLAYAAAVAVLPLHIVAGGYPTGLYSVVLATSSVVLITCELKVTTHIVRIPKRLAGFSGNVVTGAGFTAYGLIAAHPAFVIIGAVLVVTGLMIQGPSTAAHPATFPAWLRGRYLGTREAVMGMASATGPVLGLYIWGQISGSVFWVCCALLCVIAGCLHLIGLKEVLAAEPGPGPAVVPEPEVVGEKS